MDHDVEPSWPEVDSIWRRFLAEYRSAEYQTDPNAAAVLLPETRSQLANVQRGGWRWLYFALTRGSARGEPLPSTREFAQTVLRDAGPHLTHLLPQLIRAAIYEPNPSFNRRHVEPAMHAFGPRAVNEALLEYLEHGTGQEKAGAFRALYWSEVLLDERTVRPASPFSPLWEAHTDLADVWARKHTLRLRLIEEFVANEDPVARRSLATEVCFDAALYPESLRHLVKRAIEIARSHPDPFVQDWVVAHLEPRFVTVQLPDGPTEVRVLTSRREAPMPPPTNRQDCN